MLLESERNSIIVFQNVADAIVNVSNLIKIQSIFSSMGETEIESGIGSGFVWDKDGHIITNFHVVDGGSSFLIVFKDDKKQYRAKLIGADPIKDIAVLQLEVKRPSLKPIILGDSKSLLVGQKALVIGCPLGLNHTLTTGSISALERKIKGYGGVSIDGMIQTDASINPGNSGGALLDSQGKLIGINTILFNASGSQASAGLGFAIPVDIIKAIVPQLIKFGKVIRPGLGMTYLEDYYAVHLGLMDGVMIKFVDPKGPAAKADLQGITRNLWGQYFFGDIIISIDSTPVKNNDDLFATIEKHKIGDKVKIKYIRDNKEKTTYVTLSQM
ncbi:MAG: trypsin-like peptidase domain-containing protein [Bacteriovorax sp.]|nr:trypsin-like peptidase domain-containing protein [Bacteriovorax sp.]